MLSMLPRPAALALIISVFASPAAAQTVLTLGAEGAALATPDEAVAQFLVQAVKPDAASAQAAVNQAVSEAIAAARSVPGVVVTTGGYNSFSSSADNGAKPQFTAQQSLTLTQPATEGVPGPAFAALLGRLQAAGLLLNGLRGDLSPAGRGRARDEAIKDALAQLRAEAGVVAEALHKPVTALTTLTVSADAGGAPPMPMMKALAAAPAPQSAPEQITITASVSAEIVLGGTQKQQGGT
jgi:uncharacterized protein YggE